MLRFSRSVGAVRRTTGALAAAAGTGLGNTCRSAAPAANGLGTSNRVQSTGTRPARVWMRASTAPVTADGFVFICNGGSVPPLAVAPTMGAAITISTISVLPLVIVLIFWQTGWDSPNPAAGCLRGKPREQSLAANPQSRQLTIPLVIGD